MKPIILLVGLALIVVIIIPTINAEPLAVAEADADAEATAYAMADAIANALAESKINWGKIKGKLHNLAVKATDWAKEQLKK